MFGYYPNTAKTWLVVKDNFSTAAGAAFANKEVKITSEGRPYLGVPIGTDVFVESYISNKVQEWVAQLEKLALIACTQPHAAYTAFTHGCISKWTFLSRTLRNIFTNFRPLEMIIRSKLIPALTNRLPPSDKERYLLTLTTSTTLLRSHNLWWRLLFSKCPSTLKR